MCFFGGIILSVVFSEHTVLLTNNVPHPFCVGRTVARGAKGPSSWCCSTHVTWAPEELE